LLLHACALTVLTACAAISAAVQAKFGIPIVAANQLEIYTTAVLLASMKPPSNPREESWVANMNALGDMSCRAYR
jgi:phosphoenolpyruvate carboxylase